ncbi:MAG: alpha/beta fold hydrolase [Bacteroidota bacterium]
MLIRGTGPPVLLLHGNPDTSALWLSVIGKTASQARCIAPDLPGFGRSGDVPVPETLDAWSGWIEATLDAAGISEPVILAVHDLGGPIGLAWAARHPERVAGVLVTNTLFHPTYRWHVWARIWRTPILGELSLLAMNKWLFRREVERGSRQLSPSHIDGMYDAVTPQSKRAVLSIYRMLDPELFAPELPHVLDLASHVPVRVVWGWHDPYIPTDFASQFGTAEVTLLEDVGHWVPAEAPQAVADALLHLITETRNLNA